MGHIIERINMAVLSRRHLLRDHRDDVVSDLN
jgi:hypothetical protein